MQPTVNNVPKHIGLILDGNRTFSKRLMLKLWKGHEFGAEKVEKLFEWAKELGIKELTLYAFSVYNFNRPKKEFDFLMKLFKESFEKAKNDKRIHENKIRINFVGRIWMFPKDVQKKMHELMEMTKTYDNHIVNFAMAYGGKAEVTDAAIKIAKQVKEGKLNIEEINEETFSKNLYFNNDVDLIIRTSGQIRTSDFLPWQGANAEWIFLEKCWPEFEKQDLIEAVQEYSKRQRRFGH